MEKKNIIMLSVISVDADGNLDFVIEKCETRESALHMAEDSVKNWLENNAYTLDKGFYLKHNGAYLLCERHDYGNLIEVKCKENIAELDVYIKEFEL